MEKSVNRIERCARGVGLALVAFVMTLVVFMMVGILQCGFICAPYDACQVVRNECMNVYLEKYWFFAWIFMGGTGVLLAAFIVTLSALVWYTPRRSVK